MLKSCISIHTGQKRLSHFGLAPVYFWKQWRLLIIDAGKQKTEEIGFPFEFCSDFIIDLNTCIKANLCSNTPDHSDMREAYH